MYCQINDLCSYQGNAIICNAKFLVPNSPVYKLTETPTILYPGKTETPTILYPEKTEPPTIVYPGKTGFLPPPPCREHNCHNCHTTSSKKDYKTLHDTEKVSKGKTL